MSDIESISGDELNIRDADDDIGDVDDGAHNVPYDATDVPLHLSANDAPLQREIEAAVYDHGIDENRDDQVALFYTTPIKSISFTRLQRLCQRNNVNGALCILSGRHRLEIDEALKVDTTQQNVVPAVGPHFLDLVMYVGDRRGLDATARRHDVEIHNPLGSYLVISRYSSKSSSVRPSTMEHGSYFILYIPYEVRSKSDAS
ncbi:hypothetical protein EV363DRAFT_1456829 [Boletus edulis]|nr:hypothetical protein EV363DRAFT_1456829 [Boletus edulis]